MKKQKEISLRRRDVVTAYTLLRLTVGILMIAAGLGRINLNIGFKKIITLAFSGDNNAFFAIYQILLGINITCGIYSLFSIIFLCLINTWVVANLLIERENISEIVPIFYWYYFSLLILILGNNFNDFSYDAWQSKQKEKRARQSNRQNNKFN